MEPIADKTIKLMINGAEYSLDVMASDTLAKVLRNKLGLTGTKTFCESGECGVCTVILDGRNVSSCLALAIDCEGAKIETIEGLEDFNSGKLHPIQESFIENHGLQCGFCTPGMIMSAKSLLDNNPSPSDDEIKEAISGNLCRCTGYVDIVKSISSAAMTLKKNRGGE